MKLWLPAIFSLVVMLVWFSEVGAVSVMEISSGLTQVFMAKEPLDKPIILKEIY